MSATRATVARAEARAEQDLLRLDRRGFLRLTGGLAATALGASGCAELPPELRPPAELELRFLSPRSYAVLTAAAMRLVGPRGAGLIREGALAPAGTADAWLASRPALAEPLGLGLGLLEFGVFPLLRKLRPFSRLPGEAQDRVLDELMRSRLDAKRDLFKGVRSVACLSFYADPASHPVIGYPGPLATDSAAFEAALRYPVEP